MAGAVKAAVDAATAVVPGNSGIRSEVHFSKPTGISLPTDTPISLTGGKVKRTLPLAIGLLAEKLIKHSSVLEDLRICPFS